MKQQVRDSSGAVEQTYEPGIPAIRVLYLACVGRPGSQADTPFEIEQIIDWLDSWTSRQRRFFGSHHASLSRRGQNDREGRANARREEFDQMTPAPCTARRGCHLSSLDLAFCRALGHAPPPQISAGPRRSWQR